jgi:pimeloyl-ACP methyl ester carboxylesterase
LQRLQPLRAVEAAAASHLMNEENPSAVNEAILSFLARHGSHPGYP